MTGTAGVGPPTLEIRTSAGPVRYYEVGQGPALVFVHGLLVNGALWRKVVPLLSDRFRCIVPDWPLGSHHVPMSSAADLSPPGLARTVAEVWVMAHPEVNRVVDITETIDKKIAALRCHERQRPDGDGNLEDRLRTWAVANAQIAGLSDGRLAEAFRVIDTR